VGGIIWWWNPLFWFVRRKLRESAELACDALALEASEQNRRAYAEMLLELSAFPKTGAPVPVLGVSTGTRHSLERRLSMILSDRVSGKASRFGLIAAACLAIVAFPGWSLGQKPTDERPRGTSRATSRAEEDSGLPKDAGADIEARMRKLEAATAELSRFLARKNAALLVAQASPYGETSSVTREVEGDNPYRSDSYQKRLDNLEKVINDLRTKLERPAGGRAAYPQAGSPQAGSPQTGSPQATSPYGASNGRSSDSGTLYTGDDVSNLGIRFLDSISDLDSARMNLARLNKDRTTISQSLIDEAEIKLKKAERNERLMSALVKEALNAAEAALKFSQKDAERKETLLRTGAIETREVEGSRARLLIDQARVKQLKLILSTQGNLDDTGASPGGDATTSKVMQYPRNPATNPM
jgi:hypothetical protein